MPPLSIQTKSVLPVSRPLTILPPLEKLVATATAVWTRKRIPSSTQQDRMEALRKQYGEFTAVQDCLLSGKNWYQAALAVGVPPSTVHNWFEEGGVPYSICNLLRAEIPTNEVTIIPGENVGFAAFLGAFLGQVSGTAAYKRIFSFRWQSRDDPEASAFRALLDSAFEEQVYSEFKPVARGGLKGGEYLLHVQRQALSDYVQLVTGNYTTVGWEHLASFDERRHFARWFLFASYDDRGPAREKKLAELKITKQTPDALLMEQVALVFHSLGTYPAVQRTNRQKGIVFTDADDFNRLLELGCVPLMLEQRLRIFTGRKKRNQHLLAAYQATRALRAETASMEATQQQRQSIARDYGVPPQNVREWFHGKKTPWIVRRMEELARLKQRSVLEFANIFETAGTASKHIVAAVAILETLQLSAGEATIMRSKYPSLDSFFETASYLQPFLFSPLEQKGYFLQGPSCRGYLDSVRRINSEVFETARSNGLDDFLALRAALVHTEETIDVTLYLLTAAHVLKEDYSRVLPLPPDQRDQFLDDAYPVLLSVGNTPYQLKTGAIQDYYRMFDINPSEATVRERRQYSEHLRQNFPHHPPLASQYAEHDLALEFERDSRGQFTILAHIQFNTSPR